MTFMPKWWTKLYNYLMVFILHTSTHFMAIINKDNNQLNPLLSSLWDKLGSCIKHSNQQPLTESSLSSSSS